MLSRKVVTRSGRGFRGYYPSKKLGTVTEVQCESFLEMQAADLFERSAAVISYREQPAIIYYHDQNGEPKKYYPDFEVVLEGGFVVHVEVKPMGKLAKLAITKKYLAIKQHYQSRPEHFVILTEREIRSCSGEDIYQLFNNDHLGGVL